MAFKMSPDAQLIFFEKVFGPQNPITLGVKQLVEAGALITISLYTVRVDWQGKEYKAGLTQGTTSLMKGIVAPAIAAQNKKILTDMLESIPHVQPVQAPVVEVKGEPQLVSVVLNGMAGNFIVLIKAIREVTGCGLHDAKQMVDMLSAGGQVTVVKDVSYEDGMHAITKLIAAGGIGYTIGASHVAPGTQTQGAVKETSTETEAVKVLKLANALNLKPKPVPEVVTLRHAKAVGQKVKGTSSGSVYYCVALNERVRLAARIYKAGTISLRAEWEGTPTEELKKLESSGLQMKPAYASLHLNAEGVPFERVIGAFVMGTGIVWTDVVTNSAELVVE